MGRDGRGWSGGVTNIGLAGIGLAGTGLAGTGLAVYRESFLDNTMRWTTGGGMGGRVNVRSEGEKGVHDPGTACFVGPGMKGGDTHRH